jgi:hypothetical protein
MIPGYTASFHEFLLSSVIVRTKRDRHDFFGIIPELRILSLLIGLVLSQKNNISGSKEPEILFLKD